MLRNVTDRRSVKFSNMIMAPQLVAKLLSIIAKFTADTKERDSRNRGCKQIDFNRANNSHLFLHLAAKYRQGYTAGSICY